MSKAEQHIAHATPRPRFAQRLRGHLQTRLLSGILTLVPLVVTLAVLRFLLSFIASFLAPVGKLLPGLDKPHYQMLFALLGVLLVVYIIGVITTHIVGRRALALGETIMLRLPFVRGIYSATKQIVDIFRHSPRNSFKSVIMAPFPNASVRSIGFVTGINKGANGERIYRVFIPTTPNPTSGFFLMIKEESVEETDMTVEEAIRLIMSGGMLTDEEKKAD